MTPVSGRCLSALVALSALCPQAFGQEAVQPVKGLRAPLEFHPDGSVKTQLEAAKASANEKGDVTASDVRVVFRKPDGSEGGIIRARDCLYRRRDGLITSDDPVSMERDGVEIYGRGLEWSVSNKVVVIRSDARVVLARAGQGIMGAAMARRAAGRSGQTAGGETPAAETGR